MNCFPFIQSMPNYIDLAIESGQVKLPFMAKGLESVMADIEQRATAVTDVLTSHK